MKRMILRHMTVWSLVITFLTAVAADAVGQNKPPSKKDRDRAERLIDEGRRAYGQKNFQLAVSKFNDGLAVLPNNAAARFQKGQAHYFLSEYDRAVTEFDLAIRNDPKRTLEVARFRWSALEKLKRYDEALADVNRILGAEPNNQEFVIAAANLNFEKGSYKEAADGYMKVVAKAPNAGDLYYKIAVARSKEGDLVGQASAAESAITRNTQYLTESLNLLGTARFAQKRVPEAIDAFTRALRAKPGSLDAHLQLAELYRKENRIEEGLKILEDAKQYNATSGELYTELSLFYSLLERKEAAVEAGQSAAQQSSNNPRAHTNLCRAYNAAGRPEAAISSCNRALQLASEDGEALFYLARAQSEIARRPGSRPDRAAEAEKTYKRAEASLLAATKNTPDNPDAFYMLGNVYADRGESAKAIEAYQRSLELNPKLTRANFNMAVIFVNGGQKDQARSQYDLLVKSDKVLADKLKPLIDRL